MGGGLIPTRGRGRGRQSWTYVAAKEIILGFEDGLIKIIFKK